MSWVSGIVVFFLVWWLTLFAVLPIGTRPNPDGDSATGWRGAPERPLIGRKLLATTLIAAVLWGLAMWVIQSDWWSFRA